MPKTEIFQYIELALSNVWGSEVYLADSEQIEEHRQIFCLMVRTAPTGMLRTVILKRWRREGDERSDPDFSISQFFNDWAGLRFLSETLGKDSSAPHIYIGNQTKEFLILEDFPGVDSLQTALWGDNHEEAAHTMARYGKFLAELQGRTVMSLETYKIIRHQLSANHPTRIQNYINFIHKSVETLKKFDIEFLQKTLDELENTALMLSQPADFSAFTYDDPVFGNIIDWQGHWHLIDFEAAGLRHALLDGAYPRMFIPTSGLKYVLRLPEDVWQEAESANRKELSQYIPTAKDVSIFRPAMTAACAFWVLDFCLGWLERAIHGNDTPAIVDRILTMRYCKVREFFITSYEFQSMTHLRDIFEKLVYQLRSHWRSEACILPFYPAFCGFQVDELNNPRK